MKLRESIVSIWNGEPDQQGTYLHCGVCITPQHVLTAKHEIKDLVDKPLFVGFNHNQTGGVEVSDRFLHPSRDVAILELVANSGSKPVACNLRSVLHPGAHVDLLAYNKQEGCPKGPFAVQLVNQTNKNGMTGWEFHTQPVEGMSGGAVLFGRKLVGIIQARDKTENSGIFVPLSEIKDFLLPYMKAAPYWSQNDYVSRQQLAIQFMLEEGKYAEVEDAVSEHFNCNGFDNNAQEIAKRIVETAENDGPEEVLNHLAKVAQAIVNNGADFYAIEGIERLFNRVLLLTVSIDKLPLDNFFSDEPLSIEVMTDLAAVLYASAIYNVTPRFRYEVDEKKRVVRLVGEYAHKVDESTLLKSVASTSGSIRELGWGSDEIVDELECVVYTAVTGRRAQGGKLENVERVFLNEKIKLDRDGPDNRLHQFSISLHVDDTHPLNSEGVRRLLKSRLVELPVVMYGDKGSGEEGAIEAYVAMFYEIIEKKR